MFFKKWRRGVEDKLVQLNSKVTSLEFLYNDLQQKHFVLRLKFNALRERQQRHRQALNNLKRDLALGDGMVKK